ncbi:MAG: hypothetical protein BAJALOKI1v1_1770006 [Promethearchaeota archaeon]|nr:MAG: hypothetical protein BAJALOKI1v1_1770006 [Candidatus Lokiarchaeota archaeon]
MKSIKEILKNLLSGNLSLSQAEDLLRASFIKNVEGLAQLDVFRDLRTGIPEVIFAPNKTPTMVLNIVDSFVQEKHFAVVSKYTEEQKTLLLEKYTIQQNYEMLIYELAKIIIIKEKTHIFIKRSGVVGIISAGSSDVPVAEEAKIIAEIMGAKVLTSYDVGIAGIHRIFKPLQQMIKERVDVIIVLAGMEGTLPGVVASLIDVPVIGVPISSGYGIGKNGEGALITMLQSCSPGLLVVNIDNGFGAGASAALIANRVQKT